MFRTSSIRRSDQIAEQLMELKGITRQTGTVHDAQVFQLKLWGLGALPHVAKENVEIAIALPYLAEDGTTTVTQYRVEYSGETSKAPPKNLKKRLEGLDRSVKWLLGEHFALTVSINGKAIFVRKGARLKKQSVKQLLDRLKNAERPD